MKPLDEPLFQAFLQKADIRLPDQALQKQIGRELTFRHGPKRTIVVHFSKEDVPQATLDVLKIIFSLHNEWIFLPRHGYLSNWRELEVSKEDRAIIFEESEKLQLCDLVIGHFDKMFQTSDDMYICSEAGSTIVSIDHHLFDDGLNIYINDIELSGQMLQRLNAYGAELEVFYMNG